MYRVSGSSASIARSSVMTPRNARSTLTRLQFPLRSTRASCCDGRGMAWSPCELRQIGADRLAPESRLRSHPLTAPERMSVEHQRLDVDPVTADGSVLGRLKALEYPSIAFDGECRRGVVRCADDEHAMRSETPSLIQDLPQRPGSKSLSSGRRANPVADVARVPNFFVRTVPQSNPAEHLAVFDDPPVGAFDCRGVIGQPAHPFVEARGCSDVVGWLEPKADLMSTRSPLVMGFEPC